MAQLDTFASRLADLLDPPAEAYPTPGAMAVVLDPSTVQTPALDLIDAALARVAAGTCKRLIISMPPQEGKSQRTSRRFPLWLLLGDPDLRIAIASYSHTQARVWGRAIRNDLLSHDLGLRLAADSHAADDWQIDRHRGGVYCTGVGGALTGRPVDVMIIDDPVKDRAQADSPTYRDNVWSWWTDVVLTRLAPGAPVVVIMTRWHEDDLAGRLLRADDGEQWEVLNIPALADHNPDLGGSDPLGRQPGEWMISARGRTVADWEAKRADVGTRTFTALYQGRPSPEAGDVWERGWWRRYTTPVWAIHPTDGTYYVPGVGVQLVQSWDMAFKNTQSSDWVVGQVWAQHGADMWLVDQVRRRLTFTETLAEFRRLTAKWPQATLLLVEDKANGTAVIDTLRAEIPGIVPVNPTDSKYGRAVAVAPFVEAGNAHLPAGDIALFDVDGLIDEAAAFPNGAHDDQVDAASQALARLMAAARSTGGAVVSYDLYNDLDGDLDESYAYT